MFGPHYGRTSSAVLCHLGLHVNGLEVSALRSLFLFPSYFLSFFNVFLMFWIEESWIFSFFFVSFLSSVSWEMVINIARGWSFSLEFSLLFAFIFVSVNNDSFPLSPLYCLSSVCNEMTINIAR